MFWIVLFVIVGIIACCLDTVPGKIAIGSVVMAIGLLLLGWITGWGLCFLLAKICAAMIVVTVFGAILVGIFG